MADAMRVHHAPSQLQSWQQLLKQFSRVQPERGMGSQDEYLVELLDSAIEGGVPVLLVHVVVARPGLIPHPHAKVLDGRWLLLVDLHTKVTSEVRSTLLKKLA